MTQRCCGAEISHGGDSETRRGGWRLASTLDVQAGETDSKSGNRALFLADRDVVTEDRPGNRAAKARRGVPRRTRSLTWAVHLELCAGDPRALLGVPSGASACKSGSWVPPVANGRTANLQGEVTAQLPPSPCNQRSRGAAR